MSQSPEIVERVESDGPGPESPAGAVVRDELLEQPIRSTNNRRIQDDLMRIYRG